MSLEIGIVGGGVIGLATAWLLARRGHRITLFDAAAVPNHTGASSDQHRLYRAAYGAQDGYALLALKAWDVWNQLFAVMGRRLFERTGMLALCTSEGDWTDRSRHSLERLGMDHTILSPSEISQRFPFLAVADAHYGLWMNDGGVLFADRIVENLARLCRDAKVAIRSHVAVEAVGDGTIMLSDGPSLKFDKVLVAAGARTQQLLPWQMSENVTVLRQIVVYCEPPPEWQWEWRRAPILLDMGGRGGPRGMFAAPSVAGLQLKFGCGALNRPCDPDEPVSDIEQFAEAVLDAWGDRLQNFQGYRLLGHRVCHYARSDSQNLIIEQRGQTVAITGCSGHAFKLAPLLGIGLADIMEGCEEPLAWIRGDVMACDQVTFQFRSGTYNSTS